MEDGTIMKCSYTKLLSRLIFIHKLILLLCVSNNNNSESNRHPKKVINTMQTLMMSSAIKKLGFIRDRPTYIA